MAWFLLILILAALFAAWLWLRGVKYRKSVPYAPDCPYDYEFGPVEQHPVDFDGEWLRLPQIPGECSALILELKVETGLMGRLSDPEISLQVKSRIVSHIFERGASGTRYLNLTELHKVLQFEPSSTRFSTKGLSVPKQQAKLFVFKRKLRKDDRLAVIAPHPDDAEIAAYGLFSEHPRQSWLVTITPGDNTLRYRWPGATEAQASALAAKLRSTDPLACANLAGVPAEHVLNLGYFDSTLAELYHRSPEAVESMHGIAPLRQSPGMWPSLVAEIRAAMEANSISVAVCPHPFLDSHSDHFFSTLATIQAILAEPRLPVRLLLYTNHLPLSEAYPFGPSGSAVSLPPKFEGLPGTRYVLSHQLDATAQREKAYALELNHALREPPPPFRTTSALKDIKDAFRRWVLGSHSYDWSYYRRAVRQNELFFVVSAEELDTFYEAVLARAPSAPSNTEK